MASVVIDASFALALVLPDEAKPPAAMIALLERDGAVVPALWPAEVGNTLVVAERRQRVTASAIDRIVAELSTLPLTVEDRPALLSWTACIGLAMRHRLTVYDATYLELAVRRRLPLATLDKDLHRAAKAEGVGG
ncbi:MAG TPA: type II toxin-antitoxin system VapC family toxin [Rhizomicrobium sp.]|nr:type II toxin-antitoxin system VapC family toxin [Rhizomicrobium sp.]